MIAALTVGLHYYLKKTYTGKALRATTQNIRGAMLVGVDTSQVDHPLATSLGPHRGGPIMNRLVGAYQEATGLDPNKEHHRAPSPATSHRSPQ